jgi:hypothetical protein
MAVPRQGTISETVLWYPKQGTSEVQIAGVNELSMGTALFKGVVKDVLISSLATPLSFDVLMNRDRNQSSFCT